MNRKWLPYLLILGVAIALFLVRRWNEPAGKDVRTTNRTTPAASPKKTGRTASVPEINRNRGFDRRTSFLEYTRHAKCRMECRHITQVEVEEIMDVGTINYGKSDVQAKPCPEYAVEGNTADGQRVRIVFAQCDQKTKVVTVIDLGKEWSCSCEGDDKKSRK
ncbi:MAG: DUF4258 domain-containing protein [Chitinophagaceae bacterium]|nr:MAG: DUF4258 domain-containing protein [Chitinophagaceae bacterium]